MSKSSAHDVSSSFLVKKPGFVTLYGVLAVPTLSHHKNFHPDTSLEAAQEELWKVIEERYLEITGKELLVDRRDITGSIGSIVPPRLLRELKADANPFPVVVTWRHYDPDPSFLTTMSKEAAEGRKALVENLALKNQMALIQAEDKKEKKKKTKSKTRAPANDVPPSSLEAKVSELLERM
ncbi:hypothetical protein C0995_015904, partial [Termitomyces sp. Mi166